MNIAAYCRVSTEKDDQINSLEMQKKFFEEYVQRTGDHLVRLYADEGISGTKIKNRKEFQRMMIDAEKGLFQLVVVKDISRFARNTVDLLQSVRKLKALGIETQFLTANMTSMGNSEFVLTLLGAVAQEESANTSKRIKFSKKINAEKGRVPNIVYGYDKTSGDYFHLDINEKEAQVIRQIFQWYTADGLGTPTIAKMLNQQGIVTKRGNRWTTNALIRILTNEIYIGRIINGKEEVQDFLTGKRVSRAERDWMVTERPELRIVDQKTFEQANQLVQLRSNAQKKKLSRHSSKYPFSTLIKCKECGWSFRRISRTYQKTYVRWVCSGHNLDASSCANAVAVDEEELYDVLQEYFTQVLSQKKNVIDRVVRQFNKIYQPQDDNKAKEKELKARLTKIRERREKWMDMYADDLISRQELNKKVSGMRQEIEKLENELQLLEYNLSKGDQLESILRRTFQTMEDVTDVREMTNAQLKQVIQKIEVDAQGNVDIFLRLLGDLGLDQTVLVSDDSMYRRL